MLQNPLAAYERAQYALPLLLYHTGNQMSSQNQPGGRIQTTHVEGVEEACEWGCWVDSGACDSQKLFSCFRPLGMNIKDSP